MGILVQILHRYFYVIYVLLICDSRYSPYKNESIAEKSVHYLLRGLSLLHCYYHCSSGTSGTQSERVG